MLENTPVSDLQFLLRRPDGSICFADHLSWGSTSHCGPGPYLCHGIQSLKCRPQATRVSPPLPPDKFLS